MMIAPSTGSLEHCRIDKQNEGHSVCVCVCVHKEVDTYKELIELLLGNGELNATDSKSSDQLVLLSVVQFLI
jgi:hypothetical protein